RAVGCLDHIPGVPIRAGTDNAAPDGVDRFGFDARHECRNVGNRCDGGRAAVSARRYPVLIRAPDA
ncbi:MAG: hypothetical protein ABI563_19120, partial [Specibacter sp.]